MLSRWQEAAINKKYEAVLSEVKEWRGQYMVAEKSIKVFEEKYMASEETVSNIREELLKNKSELKALGAIDYANQAKEYERIIQNLSDDKD